MIRTPALFGPEDAPGQTVGFRLFPHRGPERWLLEDSYRRPWHLETWPQANRRARLIYRAARLIGALGLHLPSRRLSVMVANGSLYAQLRARFDALGVFLGTSGPNRKIVVFAQDGDKAWFIKVPISDRTQALAQNESATLAALGKEEHLAPLVPRCTWISDALAIEDVRAGGARFAPLNHAEVLRVHHLLFARSRVEVSLAELAHGWTNPEGKARPHTDPATASTIAAARDAARRFLGSIPASTRVECYDAHGDFTRWNVLRAPDGSARIIDWELFGKRPKFFDPFHYLVSQSILVNRMPADEILRQALRMAEGFMDRDAPALYFGAYLASQVFLYCEVFEAQETLHMQAHWQLESWSQLLDALVKRENTYNSLPGTP
jgi:hypothetical protein